MPKDVIEGCLTNVEFADKVGIHFSMASKLRHGTRAPSVNTVVSIWRAFDLPADEMLQSLEGGAVTFGAFLRQRVFRDSERVLEGAA